MKERPRFRRNLIQQHGVEGEHYFISSTAVEDFDFGISFEEVDSCQNSGDPRVWLAANPDIDAIAINCAGFIEVSVIKEVDEFRVFRAWRVFWSVDDNVAFGYKLTERVSEFFTVRVLGHLRFFREVEEL